MRLTPQEEALAAMIEFNRAIGTKLVAQMVVLGIIVASMFASSFFYDEET